MNIRIVSNNENEISMIIEDKEITLDVTNESIDLSDFVEILSNINEKIIFDYSIIDKLIADNLCSKVFIIVLSYIKEITQAHTELVETITSDENIDGI